MPAPLKDSLPDFGILHYFKQKHYTSVSMDEYATWVDEYENRIKQVRVQPCAQPTRMCLVLTPIPISKSPPRKYLTNTRLKSRQNIIHGRKSDEGAIRQCFVPEMVPFNYPIPTVEEKILLSDDDESATKEIPMMEANPNPQGIAPHIRAR